MKPQSLYFIFILFMFFSSWRQCIRFSIQRRSTEEGSTVSDHSDSQSQATTVFEGRSSCSRLLVQDPELRLPAGGAIWIALQAQTQVHTYLAPLNKPHLHGTTYVCSLGTGKEFFTWCMSTSAVPSPLSQSESGQDGSSF